MGERLVMITLTYTICVIDYWPCAPPEMPTWRDFAVFSPSQSRVRFHDKMLSPDQLVNDNPHRPCGATYDTDVRYVSGKTRGNLANMPGRQKRKRKKMHMLYIANAKQFRTFCEAIAICALTLKQRPARTHTHQTTLFRFLL